MKNNCKLPFSSFILKIIALLTMTCDHIGYMIWGLPQYGELPEILRILGRLAFPLFCFMIVEGVFHTKNIWKYLLRLGICALAIAVGFACVEFLPMFEGFSVKDEGNIFITLLLGALTVYLLNHKKWYIKLLSLLPVIFFVLVSIIQLYEQEHHCDVWYIPFFIRPQYEYYGLLLMVLIFLFKKISTIIKIKNETFNTLLRNLITVIAIPLATILVIYFNKIPGIYYSFSLDDHYYAWLSGIIILFYNGRRGYNKPWFQYGCYLYYAIHMLLIYGLFGM